MRKQIGVFIGIYLLFTITSCTPLMSGFDQYSYQQVTSIKVDVINLINEGTDSYSERISEVKEVQLKIDKAIEYDKHRPHDEITTKMWNKLNDPTGNLFGGFLVKWKKDGKCSATYVNEKQKQISFSFDQIAELESKKIKPSEITNQ